MRDIVAFIEARLVVDERVARAAIPDNGTGHWVAKDHEGFLHQAVADVNGLRMATGGHRFNAHAAHHDPARVLAEVAAKRRILERYKVALAIPESLVSSFVRGQDDGYRQACLDAIRDLASVFVDRDGYDPAWTVTP